LSAGRPGEPDSEPVEANTCTQFLLRQMDVVQPEVVVAAGLLRRRTCLGVKQSLAGVGGGRFGIAAGARSCVTYHPAFLLRDPRMKGRGPGRNLQRVNGEMG